MTLPTSGSLGLAAVQTEFTGSNPIGLSEYYRGAVNGYVASNNSGGINGLIPTSGAIRLSSFYGASRVALVTTRFVSTYTGNVGVGVTCQIFVGGQYIYPQWTTEGNNPASVSYVTIAGDTSGAGGSAYHWGAQATGGSGTGGQFYDSSTNTPNPTSIATKTKNLYAWSSSDILLATGIISYLVYPYPEIISISANYSGGTVTVTFTTNGFVTAVHVEYDDTAVLGSNAYTWITNSYTDGSAVSGSSGSYSFTLASGHYNTLRVTPGERINTGFASGAAKTVTIANAPAIIFATFALVGNTTGAPPDTQYTLSINFAAMGAPTGNFAYTVTVASGDAQVNSYTSVAGSFPSAQSASGNFSYPSSSIAYINLAIPHSAGTITATITKSGWATWTQTLSISADSSQNYSWVSQPTSINEGSAGTFQIQTSEHNATFGYLIDNFGPDGGLRLGGDFASMGGTFVTNSSGLGTFTVTPTADILTEGYETFKLRVKYGQSSSGSLGFVRLISNTIGINDTSTAPPIYGFYDTPGYQGWLSPTFENTVPAGKTECTLAIVGGGGGGGGSPAGRRGAGGGGGGAEAKMVTFAVTAGQSVTFEIGAGGMGGFSSGNTTNANGTDGGSTIFYIGGVAKATSIGGHGGIGSNTSNSQGGASAYGSSGGAGAVQLNIYGQVNAEAGGGGAGTGGYQDAGGAATISGSDISANAYGGDGGGATYVSLATGSEVLGKYCSAGGGGGAVCGAGGSAGAFAGTGGGSSGRGAGGAGGLGAVGTPFYNIENNGGGGITYGSGGGGSASSVGQTTGGNGATGAVWFYFT